MIVVDRVSYMRLRGGGYRGYVQLTHDDIRASWTDTCSNAHRHTSVKDAYACMRRVLVNLGYWQ